MNEILAFATLITPIITGIVEAVKRGLQLDVKYAPILAIALGAAIGVLAFPFTDIGAAERLWAGILGGLGSMGLYDLGKHIYVIQQQKRHLK
jgi:hypothetical protein